MRQQLAGIEVHTIQPTERRMLLELLASERAGEAALNVSMFGRDHVASHLCDLHMSQWISADYVTLTEYGRHVAESLAARLVDQQPTFAC